MRGIAMAQLGEHARARGLLQRAARSFGSHEALARARCVVAEAEVALAMRDIQGTVHPLLDAAQTLTVHLDHANALLAQLIAVRRQLLLGRLDAAAQLLQQLDLTGMPPVPVAVAELAAAELALRSLRIGVAQAALARAQTAARRAGVPALLAEVQELHATLDRPAARRVNARGDTPLRLREVAQLLASGALVVDACRRGLRFTQHEPAAQAAAQYSLARRPVLFELARGLAEAWPGDVDRESLIARVFRTRHPDETHRARLRVEIGRLRALVKTLARVDATPRGFVLAALGDREVVLLVPPIDGEQGSLLALLSDGAPWSTSALALALGESQRTVQRALAELEAQRRVRAIGQARARRWLSQPLAGFTTILLLPAGLPFA